MMDFRATPIKPSIWFIGVIMLLMIALSVITIISFNPSRTDPYIITNVALNSFGVVTVSILFIACAIDKSRKGLSQNSFIIVLFIEFVALFFTIQGIYTEGKPELNLLFQIDVFLYHLCPLLLSSLLWFYITFQQDEPKVDASLIVIISALLIGTAMLVLNVFTGYIYVITDEGHYNNTNAVFSFIAPVFIMSVFIIWTFINRRSLAEKIVMVMSAILIAAVLLIQHHYPEYQYIYIGTLFIILLFYSNIYIRRGYTLTQRDMEINNQRHAVMVSQIRPHFMYNVLNTIASMEDITSMKNAIGLFGRYLRGNLDTLSITGPIAFTKELEHVKVYVSLEKIRFESKIRVEYDLSELDFNVPPLSIQVLVENAIRYGISRRAEGGTVRIRTYADNKNYHVIVSDDGMGFDSTHYVPADEHHSGIENTRKRLHDMVDGNLYIYSEKGAGTVATITIPRHSMKRNKFVEKKARSDMME